jgi:hypothetical protein
LVGQGREDEGDWLIKGLLFAVIGWLKMKD